MHLMKAIWPPNSNACAICFSVINVGVGLRSNAAIGFKYTTLVFKTNSKNRDLNLNPIFLLWDCMMWPWLIEFNPETKTLTGTGAMALVTAGLVARITACIITTGGVHESLKQLT